jgi:hypothetical protein
MASLSIKTDPKTQISASSKLGGNLTNSSLIRSPPRPQVDYLYLSLDYQ